MRIVFVRFLEEIEGIKKPFRNYLTFSHLVAQTDQENVGLGRSIQANLIFSILTVLLLDSSVLRVIDASIIDYDGFMFLSFKLSSTVRNLANTK